MVPAGINGSRRKEDGGEEGEKKAGAQSRVAAVCVHCNMLA